MSENEKIDFLLQELAALPAINDESARKLEDKFRLEFSFNSNHLEGNTLTYGETKLLLIFDKTDGPHEMREFEEMKAHDVAYRWIKELAQDKSHRLIERDIKQLNQIILVRPFWKEAQTSDGQPTRRQIQVGEYKQHPNSVRLQNGEMFHYTSPMDTPMAMHDLLNWFHEEVEKKELSAVELAAIFHYKFVLIHPFDDGNGRISRLLMNFVLLRNDLPPVIIKSADKKNYLNALNQADSNNLPAFVDYITRQLIWSLQLTIKATNAESIEEEGDIDKQVSLFKKEQLSIIKQKPKKTGELVLNVYRNFIKVLLNKLDKKASEFDELFTKTNSTQSLIVGFDGNSKIKLPMPIRSDIDFENLIKDDNKKEYFSWKKEYIKALSGKTSDIIMALEIHFYEDNFSVSLDKDEITGQFSYARNLSEAEITSIVNKIYKGIFEKIQANTKK